MEPVAEKSQRILLVVAFYITIIEEYRTKMK